MEVRRADRTITAEESTTKTTENKATTAKNIKAGIANLPDSIEAAVHSNTLAKAFEQSTPPSVAANIEVPPDPSDESGQRRLDYLRQVGAEGVLDENELQVAAKDTNKLKGLLQIASSGQAVGASDEIIRKGKQAYLQNPTATGLANAAFGMVAESQGVPAEDARSAGLTTATQLLGVQANLALLGADDAAERMKDAAFYKEVRQKGLNGVYAETVIDSNGLSKNARGLNLKSVLNGLAAAQDLGLNPADAKVWSKIKNEGVQGLYKDRLIQKRGLPDTARDLNLKQLEEGIKQAHGDKSKIQDPNYWKKIADAKHGNEASGHAGAHTTGKNPFKDGERHAVGSIVHSDRSSHKNEGPSGHKASLNPLAHESSEEHTNVTHNHSSQTTHTQNSDRQKQNSTQKTQTERSWGYQSEKTTHGHVSERHGGSSEGSASGNSTTGDGQSDAPTQGTNERAGAANDFSESEGNATQTGTGISSQNGQEAGSGAVYTVIDGGSDDGGTVSYIWTASGDGVRNGIYQTTYTPNSDGTWSYSTTVALTGEQVDSGEGAPPDPSIVGTSTQSTEGDFMLFATSEDDGSDDDDGEDKPLPFDTGRPSHVISASDWRFVAKSKGQDGDIDPSPEGNAGRAPLPPWAQSKQGGGYTDPTREGAPSRNVFGKSAKHRGSGYTDPSPEGGSRGPGSTAPKPSRAKGNRNAQGAQHHSRRRTNH